MRALLLVLAVVLGAPSALAEHPAPWGLERDGGYGFVDGPQVEAPDHVVQGERVMAQIMKMPDPDVTFQVRTAEGARVLFEARERFTWEAEGAWWGAIEWRVPRDLPEGEVVLAAQSAGGGASTTATVWTGPRIFVRIPETPEIGRPLVLAVTGFDAAPATATIAQDEARAVARWENASVDPMTRGIGATLTGGDWPEGAIRTTEEAQSILLSILALHPAGGEIVVAFEGLVDGAPRTLEFRTTLPTADGPRVILRDDRPTEGSAFQVLLSGVDGDVTAQLGNATARAQATHGMALLTLAPTEAGTATLRIETSTGFVHEQALLVHAQPPVAASDEGDVPGRPRETAQMPVPASTALVAGLVALALLRRR